MLNNFQSNDNILTKILTTRIYTYIYSSYIYGKIKIIGISTKIIELKDMYFNQLVLFVVTRNLYSG